ncbi:MAG: uracil-DNA glycosylase family protein [Dehalococcoidia bacterium]
MTHQSYEQLAESIFTCGRCSLWDRERPGYFPKFGAGNPDRPRVMLLTQNPAEPNDREKAGGNARVSPREMREMYAAGIAEYHNDARRGGGIDLGTTFAQHGIRWLAETYYSEAFKCVASQLTAVAAEEAAEACRGHLAAELSLVAPRSIITLGGGALRYLYLALGKKPPRVTVTQWWASEPLEPKQIWRDGDDPLLVLPLFHPSPEGWQRAGLRQGDWARAFERCVARVVQLGV